MPKVCVVPHCGVTTQNTRDRSFHQFPQDSSLRNAWMKRINRQNFQPNKSSAVCSHHFGEEHYRRPNSETPAQFRKATLKLGSLPTYNLLSDLPESFVSTSGKSTLSNNSPEVGRNTSIKEKKFLKPRESERLKTTPTKVCPRIYYNTMV